MAAPRREPKRLIGHPHSRNTVLAADSQQHLQQGWMQMEMLVHIDVIESQARSRERRKLCADLRFQLSAHRGKREETYTIDEHPAVHASGSVGESRDEIGRQHGAAVRKDEMQTHT